MTLIHLDQTGSSQDRLMPVILPGGAIQPCDDLRAIIDGLSESLIVVDLEYRVLHANRLARARAGLSDDEDVSGRNCHDLYDCGQPYDSPGCSCPLSAAVRRGEPVKATHYTEDPVTGERQYVDVIASPLRDRQGNITGVIETVRDATEERRLEDSLVARHEQLSILHGIASTVSQSLDLADILGRALDEVLNLTGVDAGAVFLREETLGHLVLLSHRGLSAEAARMASQFGMLDGGCGGVIDRRQVVVVPDIAQMRSRRANTLRRENLRTLVHVPLVAKGRALGSMCVGTRTPREFDPTERELFSAIGNQIAVAVENARLYGELQRKEFLRGELLKKVISAQEEERKRIARELHDDTSQALTALLFAAEEAQDVQSPEKLPPVLENMRALARRTLDGVHKLIFDLRPTMLDHLGLVPAVRWLAKSRLEPAGVRVVVEEHGASRRLPSESETALYRVIQEAISNISRHALARNVTISFTFQEDDVAVDVSDDGSGFDLVAVTLSPDSGRGLGLMGMRERVELLGGQMTLDTAPGMGTRLHLRLSAGPLLGVEERSGHA